VLLLDKCVGKNCGYEFFTKKKEEEKDKQK
jgi:hypothetical protein